MNIIERVHTIDFIKDDHTIVGHNCIVKVDIKNTRHKYDTLNTAGFIYKTTRMKKKFRRNHTFVDHVGKVKEENNN